MKNSKRFNPSGKKNTYHVRLPKNYHWVVLDRLVADLKQYLNIYDFGRIRAILDSRDTVNLTALFEEWGLQSFRNASLYLTFDNLKARYQLSSLLKKYQHLDVGIDKEANAFSTFVKAEIYCRVYNQTGRHWLTCPDTLQDREVLLHAREWIRKVIGESLPEADELTLTSRHGPGASTNTHKGNTAPYFKYEGWPYDVTARAFRVAVSAIQQDERWWGVLEEDYRKRNDIPPTLILNQERFWHDVLNIVPGNKISFVPKSYKTHRTIAVEPTLNLYLQLGVDGFIRKRLKRWGLDLDDQSRNRALARLGSQGDGPKNLCTLDLSMASDTISTSIVRDLLPHEWYSYLMDIRSPSGVCEGRFFRYEKISSMGNGFTFVLETLIFAALLYGLRRSKRGCRDFGNTMVYGDDIIIEAMDYAEYVTILSKCGFHVNTEKSFSNGFIRESCGADWFQGKPVRPVFLKELPSNAKELVCEFNRLKRQLDLHYGIQEEDSHVLAQYLKWLPTNIPVGPYSDEEFDTYRHTRKRGRWKKGVWLFKRMIKRPVLLRKKKFGFTKLCSSLRGRQILDPYNPYRDIQSGCCFEVPVSNSWYLATINSAAIDWQSEYASLG